MLDKIKYSVKQFLFRITIPNSFTALESFKEPPINPEPPIENAFTYSETEEALLDMAGDIGTLIWRIRNKLLDINDSPANLRRVSRDCESIYQSLAQNGFEIKTHNSQEYYSGMALKVIASQPVVNLKQQEIIETLKPTIYYKDKILQMGEVIVGTPEESEVSAKNDNASPNERQEK